ncbi:MAG: hypothetical protein QN141_08950 [Armatimonadota bacterium]|nr:hypothetical protein [Armatimonadota bacterium]MDR7451838.1 hypothetical protein [Armatimonadota bacterium]MDR7467563.1 hypothetical protein [Armatimonadota bacterium]MDR7494476.1 hypothetical protein [Armatimonadota bacterium]MDR7499737.1 hypothetical protein [Armatimonadota bacterium]
MRRNSEASALTPDDRRFLAAIVRQVWRAAQAYVAVAVEGGPAAARTTIADLGQWAAAQRRLLARRPTRAVTADGLRIGGDLLDDVGAICRRVDHLLGTLDHPSISRERAEEEALALIEGVVSWTSLMAAQLGLARHLRPRILEYEG